LSLVQLMRLIAVPDLLISLSLDLWLNLPGFGDREELRKARGRRRSFCSLCKLIT
jgi:hypothetical protein